LLDLSRLWGFRGPQLAVTCANCKQAWQVSSSLHLYPHPAPTLARATVQPIILTKNRTSGRYYPAREASSLILCRHVRGMRRTASRHVPDYAWCCRVRAAFLARAHTCTPPLSWMRLGKLLVSTSLCQSSLACLSIAAQRPVPVAVLFGGSRFTVCHACQACQACHDSAWHAYAWHLSHAHPTLCVADPNEKWCFECEVGQAQQDLPASILTSACLQMALAESKVVHDISQLHCTKVGCTPMPRACLLKSSVSPYLTSPYLLASPHLE